MRLHAKLYISKFFVEKLLYIIAYVRMETRVWMLHFKQQSEFKPKMKDIAIWQQKSEKSKLYEFRLF